MKEVKLPLYEGNDFHYIEGIEIADCWGCGAKTNRVDVGWGAHICSPGCRKIVDLRATADNVRLVKNPDYPEDQWWSDYDVGDQNTQWWEA